MFCRSCGAQNPDDSRFCEECGNAFSDTGRSGSGTDSAPRARTTGPGTRDPLLGRTLEGVYRVEDVLGRGGMGVVYRAVNVRLDMPVALKVLASNLAHDQQLMKRFEAEARTQARLRHPNIVAVKDFICDEGVYAIVMERVDGATLEEVIHARTGPMPYDRIMGIMAPSLEALGVAHEQGIVHRDIKPANIMLTTVAGREVPKVMDFGIAKALQSEGMGTATSSKLGTLWYMPPEQCVSSRDVDARSDLYALGVTLYEMACGTVPFAAQSEFEVMRAHMEQEPRPPSEIYPGVSPGLERVILRALEKDPGDRFQSAKAFADALDACSADPKESPEADDLPADLTETVHDMGPPIFLEHAPEPMTEPKPVPGSEPTQEPRPESGSAVATPRESVPPPPQQPVAVPARQKPAMKTWPVFVAVLAMAMVIGLLVHNMASEEGTTAGPSEDSAGEESAELDEEGKETNEEEEEEAEVGSAGVKAKVKVTMYVMSQCPYGVMAVDAFLPVLKEMGGHVDFRLEYIGDFKDGKPTSMHGEAEVKGDIHQLCARDLYSQQRKWTAFVACENKTWRSLPAGWEKCAREAGMDVGKMKSCIEGTRGVELLKASIKVSKKANASGSPTIIIGGTEHSGDRNKLDYMRSICAKLPKKIPVCAKIPPKPPEPEVAAIIISDKRCPKCEKRIKEVKGIMMGRFFPKLKVTKRLDWSASEAKELCKKHKIKKLPTMLLAAGAEKAAKFEHLKRFLTKNGEYWQLTGIGIEHDPTAEICDNNKDDTGNGKADCADPTCWTAQVCRQEIKKDLKVFIVSQCPFGVKAINAMKELTRNFGDDFTFTVHYIGDVNAEGEPTAMHGQTEVDENIRMLCAAKYYARKRKYLDYMWCRFQGNDWRTSDWKKCARKGISTRVIAKCFRTEGPAMLLKDTKLARALSIGASPTWLANNRYKFSGIAPENIKKELCKRNPGMKNCHKKLKGGAPVKGSCGG